jgi:hypothetical protein
MPWQLTVMLALIPASVIADLGGMLGLFCGLRLAGNAWRDPCPRTLIVARRHTWVEAKEAVE